MDREQTYQKKNTLLNPETTFLKGQTVVSAEDEQMFQGLSLGTEKTFFPNLRIHKRSVSVRSYCPMHNPPLEVCCPLFNMQLVQGPPAAFHGNIWTKKLHPPRLLH